MRPEASLVSRRDEESFRAGSSAHLCSSVPMNAGFGPETSASTPVPKGVHDKQDEPSQESSAMAEGTQRAGSDQPQTPQGATVTRDESSPLYTAVKKCSQQVSPTRGPSSWALLAGPGPPPRPWGSPGRGAARREQTASLLICSCPAAVPASSKDTENVF